MIDKQHITARFIKYITIDTESNPKNPAFPSSENQWNLARILEKELHKIGMQDYPIYHV